MSTDTLDSTRNTSSLAGAAPSGGSQAIAELPEASANPSGRSPYSQQLDSSIRNLTRQLLANPQDAQVRRELNHALHEARHNINAVVSMDALIAADRILRGTKPTRGAGIPTGKFEFERYLGVPDRFAQVKVGTSDGEPVIQTRGGTYRIPDSVNANKDEELRSWVRGAIDSKSISNLYPLKTLTPSEQAAVGRGYPKTLHLDLESPAINSMADKKRGVFGTDLFIPGFNDPESARKASFIAQQYGLPVKKWEEPAPNWHKQPKAHAEVDIPNTEEGGKMYAHINLDEIPGLGNQGSLKLPPQASPAFIKGLKDEASAIGLQNLVVAGSILTFGPLGAKVRSVTSRPSSTVPKPTPNPLANLNRPGGAPTQVTPNAPPIEVYKSRLPGDNPSQPQSVNKPAPPPRSIYQPKIGPASQPRVLGNDPHTIEVKAEKLGNVATPWKPEFPNTPINRPAVDGKPTVVPPELRPGSGQGTPKPLPGSGGNIEPVQPPATKLPNTQRLSSSTPALKPNQQRLSELTPLKPNTPQPRQQEPLVPLPDPLRLKPSKLPEEIDAVIRNPDGSWRAHVKTGDGGQVGALVELRPNGKSYVRTATVGPDAETLGSPMEFIADKNLYIGIDRQTTIYTRAFDPTVEVTIPQEKTFSNSILSTVSKPFENIAIKIRQSGYDFRIGVQAEAGLSVPGPGNVLEEVGIQNLGATNILGQLFNKMMDVEWLRFGKVGSGSLVIGLDSFSAHSWTRFFGIGGRPAELLTQGPQVGRFSGFIPLTNATGLQLKVSTLSKEVIKAFVGEKSPFVFEPEGTVEAKHDTFKIPGKLRLNVVPLTQTPAGKDVFGVPIRPNAQYHVLQEALTIDKAMKEHYLKFPLVFYGERREETSGKFTFPKGAVLPDEFVKMFDRYVGEPDAIVNVPVRHADIHYTSTITLPKSSSSASSYVNADNLGNPFRQGPNGEPPRIKYDPDTLTVDFESKSAIRHSSVPGKEFYNKMGKLSQDISNLDVMVYESKFGKMVTPAKATELFPQSIPGVSDLFKVLQPYGGFDKVRYKANLVGVNFWLAKFSIPVYFVRDTLEINPRIQSTRTSSILFNTDGSLASAKAGEVDLRRVTSSIAVPEWLPHLFSREINTLPNGAHESVVTFLNKRKETATAHQLAAIEIFEKSTLQTGFRDLQPLSTEGRDHLLGLLRELSTPTAK